MVTFGGNHINVNHCDLSSLVLQCRFSVVDLHESAELVTETSRILRVVILEAGVHKVRRTRRVGSSWCLPTRHLASCALVRST